MGLGVGEAVAVGMGEGEAVAVGAGVGLAIGVGVGAVGPSLPGAVWDAEAGLVPVFKGLLLVAIEPVEWLVSIQPASRSKPTGVRSKTRVRGEFFIRFISGPT